MSGSRANPVLLSGPTLSQQRASGAISLQGHDISVLTRSGPCPCWRSKHRLYKNLAYTESRQDIIRVGQLTRKPRVQRRVHRWTPRDNCAIIALWKPAAHNAEPR